MPGTRDIGHNIADLYASHSARGKARHRLSKSKERAMTIAIALDQARRAGANIPRPKRKR
jgi:hypothetical protein